MHAKHNRDIKILPFSKELCVFLSMGWGGVKTLRNIKHFSVFHVSGPSEPAAAGEPAEGEKEVDSVVVWSDPRIPSEFLESHGTPQTTTKTISYSTLRRPGGARGGRGARRGLKKYCVS